MWILVEYFDDAVVAPGCGEERAVWREFDILGGLCQASAPDYVPARRVVWLLL